MISSLSGFDNLTAAGILARMALALDDDGNPAAHGRLPDEANIRDNVRAEMCAILGMRTDDYSAEAVEKFNDALDEVSDSLLGPLDLQEALANLSKKGQLPSDLYHVRVGANVEALYGDKFPAELGLTQAAVREPDQEQHFGAPEEAQSGHLISVFAKHFPNKFPYQSFTLLVVGQRQGTILEVAHVWRLYADRVDFTGVSDLIDVIRRFADVYGAEVKINGVQGRFFFSDNIPFTGQLEDQIEILPRTSLDQRGRKKQIPSDMVDIGFFRQFKKIDGTYATLVVAIDRVRYLASLTAHGW